MCCIPCVQAPVVRIGREEDEAPCADGLRRRRRPCPPSSSSPLANPETKKSCEPKAGKRTGAAPFDDRHHVVVVVQRPVEGADARVASGLVWLTATRKRLPGHVRSGRRAGAPVVRPSRAASFVAAADADEAAAPVHPRAKRILPRLSEVQRGDLRRFRSSRPGRPTSARPPAAMSAAVTSGTGRARTGRRASEASRRTRAPPVLRRTSAGRRSAGGSPAASGAGSASGATRLAEGAHRCAGVAAGDVGRAAVGSMR